MNDKLLGPKTIANAVPVRHVEKTATKSICLSDFDIAASPTDDHIILNAEGHEIPQQRMLLRLLNADAVSLRSTVQQPVDDDVGRTATPAGLLVHGGGGWALATWQDGNEL